MSTRNQPSDQLTRHDGEILDQLVESGFDPAAFENLGSEDQERVNAITGLFRLLDDYPVEDCDESLVDATISRVHRSDDARSVVARLESAPSANRWRIRVPDVITVAAVVLVAASIAIPIMGMVRQRAIDAGCVSNLRAVGIGFANYARDYDGYVPMAIAGFGLPVDAPSWVDPSPLAQYGYCEQGNANCPGHPDQGGYSRQINAPGDRFAWFTGPTEPVMGDRNPVIDAHMSAGVIDPFANSRGHGGRGQNILMKDGATHWLEKPVLESRDRVPDNIWLIRGTTRFEPGAVPDSNDVFLAQ